MTIHDEYLFVFFLWRMQLIPHTDSHTRNTWIHEHADFYTFLQSREWGEVNKKLWHEIIRYDIIEAEEWKGESEKRKIWCLQLIKHEARRWTYLLCPHGPVRENEKAKKRKSGESELLHFHTFALSHLLKTIAHEHHASFVRLCPLEVSTKESLGMYEQSGFRYAPLHAHTEESNILDLTPDCEILLKNMRETTRYMIKRAAKEGVTVYKDNSPDRINEFCERHLRHAQRTNGKLNYTPFSKDFIISLFEIFDERDISLFVAEYEGQVEAMVVSIIYGQHAAYYLGVSDIRHPKFSPAYICQREAIQYAKSQWCTDYNFRWVPPDDNKKHPLYGPGLFKRWFGGKDIALTHAHDLVVNPLSYSVTRLIEKYRAWKRGYYYVRPKD